MFNRRKRNCFDTIRAEDLHLGDRFVFDNRAIKVVSTTCYNGETVVLMETTHLGSFHSILSATFPNEMFVTISRR